MGKDQIKIQATHMFFLKAARPGPRGDKRSAYIETVNTYGRGIIEEVNIFVAL